MELVHQVVPWRIEALEKNDLSRELEMDELETVMRELANEKSPRSNIFPEEFYK